MRRVLSAALAALVISPMIGDRVVAQEATGCTSTKERDDLKDVGEVVCRAAAGAATPGASVSPRSRAASRRPAPDLIRIPELGNVPPVGLCRQRGSTTITRQELALRSNDEIWLWLEIVRSFPPCRSVQIEPEEAAIAVLERVPLPAPAPVIAPGWAITGKPAFLEPHLSVPIVGGVPTLAESRPTELGDMAVSATATYRVDWGDTETGPHAGPGGPWPGGNIVHTWTDMGTYDVVVTAEWTVDWRLGAASGRLTVPTTGTIPGFRVTQVQAVRNR